MNGNGFSWYSKLLAWFVSVQLICFAYRWPCSPVAYCCLCLCPKSLFIQEPLLLGTVSPNELQLLWSTTKVLPKGFHFSDRNETDRILGLQVWSGGAQFNLEHIIGGIKIHKLLSITTQTYTVLLLPSSCLLLKEVVISFLQQSILEQLHKWEMAFLMAFCSSHWGWQGAEPQRLRSHFMDQLESRKMFTVHRWLGSLTLLSVLWEHPAPCLFHLAVAMVTLPHSFWKSLFRAVIYPNRLRATDLECKWWESQFLMQPPPQTIAK